MSDIIQCLYGELGNYYNNFSFGIRVLSAHELIEEWLHDLKISYSLTCRIHQSDNSYFRNNKCCFCSKKDVDMINLFNGFHRHKCGINHYWNARDPIVTICNSCFTFAIQKVQQNRLLVYRVIKIIEILPDDCKNTIISYFVKVTRYYTHMLSFVDC